jgi:hypothetical protein
MSVQLNNVGIKGIVPSAQIYAAKAFDDQGQGTYSLKQRKHGHAACKS